MRGRKKEETKNDVERKREREKAAIRHQFSSVQFSQQPVRQLLNSSRGAGERDNQREKSERS
jgi:hypothetical protein